MSIPASERPTESLGTLRPDPVPAPPPHCLNCGAMLRGPYCGECGQRATNPHPTTRELLQEAAEELFNWDGKLLGTLRALVAHPGRLTLDVLAGKRARYLPPLRLYLIFSVLYFFVAAAMPNKPDLQIKTSRGSGIISVDSIAPGNERARTDSVACFAEVDREQGSSGVARAIGRAACRGQVNRKGFSTRMRDNFPRMMFVLVPLYAAILGTVYRKRRYPEHLYFALHLHAFVFLALTVATLTDVSPARTVDTVVGFACFAAVLVYSVLALRAVYGGSLAATLGKSAAIALLYGVVFFVALAGAALITLLTL